MTDSPEGSAKQEVEASDRKRPSNTVSIGKIVLTAVLTAVVSNAVTFTMWLTQQTKLQQWSTKAIVEATIDAQRGQKRLMIRNVGTVNIEDVRVFATVYELKPRPSTDSHHSGWGGIANVSKAGPLRTFDVVQAAGGVKSIDLLTEFQQMTPMYRWEPSDPEKRANTYYVYRVTFRHGISKQRYVAHVFSTPYSDFNANPFGDAETTAGGGGYEATRHLVEIRNLLKRDQLDLFDNLPSDLYQR